MEQSEKLISETKQKIVILDRSKELKDEEKQVEDKKNSLKVVKKRTLNWVDSVIAVFLIGPLVVGFWRGTWNLMGIYEQNHPNALPKWESFFFSVLLLFSFSLLRDAFIDYFKKKKETLLWRVFSHVLRKLYTYVFAITCIMHWHSTWEIGNKYFSELNDSIVVTTLAILTMIILKSLRNTVAPPLIIALDYEDVTFTFPTRFRKKVSYNLICDYWLFS